MTIVVKNEITPQLPIINTASLLDNPSIDSKHERDFDGVVSNSHPSPLSTNVEQIITKALSGRCILFGQNCDLHFAFLDNDYPSPLEFGGRYYKCATAAYESQKFFHRPDLMDLFTTVNAREVLAFSAMLHLEKHLSWYAKREETMLHVLRAKFGQNLDLKHFLLLTVDCYLLFHTGFKQMDPFWTDDADGSGRNRLGRLLMMIRKEYGGIGEGEQPSKSNYDQFLPQKEMKNTIEALDKSDSAILAEINDLNAKINDEDYKSHSQIARRVENHAFTRFPNNNFPYDATLVRLSSDRYINASFVLGQEFICTQSPMPETIEDFWSMVLEQNVSIVIMLNRLTDPGDDIYFPFSLNDKKEYGKIHLELIETPFFKTDPSWRQAPHEEEPHAIIHRKMRIWQNDQGIDGARLVHHFQYQNWRDFSAGNERSTAYLVKTVDEYRDERPIAIHCHAGVGRSAAVITLLDQMRSLSSGEIDIKHSVERQRSTKEGRCNSMMQSTEQYMFCYRTLRLLAQEKKLF